MTPGDIETWRAIHRRQHNQFVALVIGVQVAIVAIAVLAC